MKIAIAALRAGKHVIADKPLCTSLLGLSRARVELPTPHGIAPCVTVPDGVTVERGGKG